MKLELEFTITETSDDTIEGTWHGNIDDDAVYFIINTLNQLNADLIRNKLLLKVLPLKV